MRRANVLQDTCTAGGPLYVNLQNIYPKFCQNKYRFFIDGVSLNGQSTVVEIEDFRPFFLMEPPSHWDVADFSLYIDDFKSSVYSDMDLEKYSIEHNEPIYDVKLWSGTPFIGFTNRRKDVLLKVFVRTIGMFRRVVRSVQNCSYKTFQADYTFANQFLHFLNIPYQSWVRLDSYRVRQDRDRLSTACLEVTASIVDIKSAPESTSLPVLPKTLSATLRIKCISADSVSDPTNKFQPDFRRAFDRIVAITLLYRFADDAKPIHCETFTSIPLSGDDVTVVRTEKELLTCFRNSIVDWDPDDIVIYSDFVHPLRYIAGRAVQLGVQHVLEIERVKSASMLRVPESITPIRDSSEVGDLPDWEPKLVTRSVLDMKKLLMKKVFISVESYDLYTVSAHKAFRKSPVKNPKNAIYMYESSSFYVNAEQRHQIVKDSVAEAFLLLELEKDTGSRLEIANISRVSDTTINDCVHRGEQIRVFNKLTHFCNDHQVYINKQDLTRPPLRFGKSQRPPTYADPDMHPVTQALFRQCERYVQEKKQYHTKKRRSGRAFRTRTFTQAFGSSGSPSSSVPQEAVSEAEGGNVMKPCAKFWGATRLGILDFKSLYPSIMIAFNISYENLVNDEKYLDLPGVEYITVSINSSETVVVAKQKGIIPRLLELLVKSRDAIKAVMRKETDSFRRAVYDKQQNSMKVLCNATYGFCGASEKAGILAIREVMFIVTSLGRYLQKKTADHLAVKYGIPTVYGDTDSVFVQIPVQSELEIEAFTEFVVRKYEMSSMFRSWSDVARLYLERTKNPIDFSDSPLRIKQNAVLFLVYDKLCEECTDLFPHPVILEFENMADNVWMGWQKKTYMYRFWDPSEPRKWKKIKITGMPVKKREYSAWTRDILQGVNDLLLNDRASELTPYLHRRFTEFVNGQVSVSALRVSRSYQGLYAYKSERQPQIQVALKMRKERRYPVQKNSRLFFVISKGKDKMFLRAVQPHIVESGEKQIDYLYYFDNQLKKPLGKLLTYHPEHVHFERLFANYRSKLINRRNGIRSMFA